jgi:hypothetical protein
MVDHHHVPYYTRFISDDFLFDVTVQNVENDWTTAKGYINETIDSISPYITANNKWRHGSLTIQNVDYNQEMITGIDQEMNYYIYFFIRRKNVVALSN